LATSTRAPIGSLLPPTGPIGRAPKDAGRYPAWEQVRFTSDPVIIHPLSGETIELAPLAADIGAAEAKAVRLDHFQRLIQDDPHKAFLAFWRFGPELRHWAPEVGNLWKTLPADLRTPDHSIWSHVDSVSALATALAVIGRRCSL
jgi:CRISPR-associated protein Cmr2